MFVGAIGVALAKVGAAAQEAARVAAVARARHARAASLTSA